MSALRSLDHAGIAVLEDVRYQYPRTSAAVLDGVSWTIAEGSFALLIGLSGTGKSTMLRCLNGLRRALRRRRPRRRPRHKGEWPA